MNKPPTHGTSPLTPRIALAAILLGLSMLSGCGGGSGGGSASSAGGGGATPPTASSGAIQANEDTPVSGTLTANDVDGDPLTYSIVSQGSRGTATITNPSSGAFTYSPNLDQFGSDSFTFRVTDGTTYSNTATVAVTILAVDDAPVAQDGNLLTTEDIPAAGNLFATDVELQSLTYSIVTNGSKGTATITNGVIGAYIYVPAPDANGVDTFTFIANDGTLDSNIATVTVVINPVNDAPVALPGSMSTNEDTAGAGTLTATDAEMQSLTYSIATNAGMGTATITNPATGAFIYVPDPDTNGIDTFTFIASDGLVDSDPGTMTVTVNPVNDPPVATGSCSTTRQAQALSGTLSASDMESPGMLTYTLGDGSTGPFTTPVGGQVTITNTTTGAFSYTPLASGGGRGTDSFAFRVMDPEGEIDTATETVVVDQAIMPLGDSITQGTINGSDPPFSLRVGFRKPLQDTLLASGYSFDLVGTRSDGNAVPNFDFNHEGHGGWTAAEIAWGMTGYPTDGVRAWLDTNPSDVVLLHIGTNALDPNNDIDVEAILDEIDLWEGSAGGNPVTVILALIIDQDPIHPDVVAFNNNVAAMANLRINSGDDIIIANIHDALNYPVDMANQLHPTEVGYSKMATVWFNNLTAVLEKCP